MKQVSSESSVLGNLISKTYEQQIPIAILFELTYRCNLRCSHCYITDREEAGLPREAIEKILDQLAEEGTIFLTLSGGEIFMRQDFFQIAYYARSKGFALNLFTNGTLIDEAVANEISKLSPWKVEISIYGATPNTHDKITRIAGSWKKSLKAIKLLKERGVNVMFKALWMRENIHEVEMFLQLKEDLAVAFRATELISPCDNGYSKPLSHRLSDEQLIHLNQRLQRNSKNEMRASPSADNNKIDLSQTNLCNAGINYAVISPSGELYPCLLFPQSAGDLTKESFKEIWRNSAFLRKLRNTHLSDLKECSTCPYLFDCPRCPAMSALEEGDWLKPWREACRIARIAFKEIPYEQEKKKVSKT